MILIEWYVYHHDSNAQKIIKWNVFTHRIFKEEVTELLKRNLPKDEFAEELKNKLLYSFWSRCEYEIILSSWVGYADNLKIDIYDQITMNWNSFVNYVWNFKEG